MTYKTHSEECFARYLHGRSLDHVYEPDAAGPDFLVRHMGMDVYCEVTERDLRNLSKAVKGIRQEIEDKSYQGRKAKGKHPYVLVLQFLEGQNADLDESLFPEAMFGTHQATWTIDEQDAVEVSLGFGSGGRLQRRLHTRFSAVLSLQEVNPTFVDLLIRIHESWNTERAYGASHAAMFATAETLKEQAISDGSYDPSLSIPRLLVFHNPNAAVALPTDLFEGPYDLQWASIDYQYARVAVGEKAVELDEKLKRLEEVKGDRLHR